MHRVPRLALILGLLVLLLGFAVSWHASQVVSASGNNRQEQRVQLASGSTIDPMGQQLSLVSEVTQLRLSESGGA